MTLHIGTRFRVGASTCVIVALTDRSVTYELPTGKRYTWPRRMFEATIHQEDLVP